MRLPKTSITTYLRGAWTRTGMTQGRIESLNGALEQSGPGSKPIRRIDCHQITDIDASGLQILYVWLQCLKIRGIEPVLVNLTDSMKNTFQGLGFRNCHSA